MASVAAMSTQRQKKMVRYGKAGSRPTFSTMHLDSFMSDEPIVPPGTVRQRTQTVKDTYAIEKPAKRMSDPETTSKPVMQQPPKVREKKHELFDVPSSDDEPEPVAKRTKPASKLVESEPAPSLVSRPAEFRTKEQDLFDVPPSDDDAGYTIKRATPPQPRTRRVLVNDTQIRGSEMAPWERGAFTKAKGVNKATPELGRGGAGGSQKQTGTVKGVANDGYANATATVEIVDTNVSEDCKNPSSVKDPPDASSAVARLLARKKKRDGNTQPNQKAAEAILNATGKRDGSVTDEVVIPTRKRVKRATQLADPDGDTSMADAHSNPMCEAEIKEPNSIPSPQDVFDFPEASEDKATQSRAAEPAPKLVPRPARRGKLRSTSKPAATKGLSAPGRLAEMLQDADSTDALSRSPSMTNTSNSRLSTPRRSATPTKSMSPSDSSARRSSPATAIKNGGPLTPTQANLWDRLLSSDRPSDSPSALPIAGLHIDERRRRARVAAPLSRTLTKSISDVPEMHRQRTRLVDRLKASAPSTDAEMEDDETDTDVDVDVDVEALPTSQTSDVLNDGMAEGSDQKASISRSQSQSQTSVPGEGGVRVTYARTRSYLPEDSFEDGLLADASSFTPMAPKYASSTSQMESQKSAFDVEESEDEGSTARMRTVHELRAAGRNKRFEQQTVALLEEISDHNVSARSRRRSALVEIATKLMEEEGFIERFFSQGFESRLVAECNTPEDEIADFALVACFALLLSSEQAIGALIHGDLLRWIVGLLNRDIPIARSAKDRRNNMSKSAQSIVMEFGDKLRLRTSLWQEVMPSVVTPRLVALKALDLLVGRLRRAGDRTELLGVESLTLILSASNEGAPKDIADLTLSLSILELLCASTQPRIWPEKTLKHLAAILHDLSTQGEVTQHARFLTYRLLLALTNDNAENCKALASVQVVTVVLQAVAEGFKQLKADLTDEQRALQLDLVVLALGVMINLAECDASARQHAIHPAVLATLTAIVKIFRSGQEGAQEAESVEDTRVNVAYGYLAIMLANICLSDEARVEVAALLPGRNLDLLVEAVGEFVMHNQKVDMLEFEGAEGREVWDKFTERLRGVLVKLELVAGMV